MANFIVVHGMSPVGRLSCTTEFADAIANATECGVRWALDVAYEKPFGEKPEIVQFSVSPLPRQQPTLTDAERKAIMASQGFWALEDSPHAATLRSLLERMK
jgi:hypothetical protein